MAKNHEENSLLKQLLCLTQSELESMSITRQGTIHVKVANGYKLPDMEVKGANVKVGDGRIIVTKPASMRPYAGNTSKVILQTKSEFGTATTRVTKDGNVLINFVGTTKSVGNYEDVASALYCSSELVLKAMKENNIQEVDTKEVSDEIFLQYSRAKENYDREEKNKVRSWERREKNDLQKLGIKPEENSNN